MGDGGEVVKHLTEKVITDYELAYQIYDRKMLTNETLLNACKLCLGIA
jgi:hypothetical protein